MIILPRASNDIVNDEDNGGVHLLPLPGLGAQSAETFQPLLSHRQLCSCLSSLVVFTRFCLKFDFLLCFRNIIKICTSCVIHKLQRLTPRKATRPRTTTRCGEWSKRSRRVETKATKANRMKTERSPSFHFPIQSTPVLSLQSASGSV